MRTSETGLTLRCRFKVKASLFVFTAEGVREQGNIVWPALFSSRQRSSPMNTVVALVWANRPLSWWR